MPGPGGVCSWGVPGPGGWVSSGGRGIQHALRQTPPVDRMTDRQV